MLTQPHPIYVNAIIFASRSLLAAGLTKPLSSLCNYPAHFRLTFIAHITKALIQLFVHPSENGRTLKGAAAQVKERMLAVSKGTALRPVLLFPEVRSFCFYLIRLLPPLAIHYTSFRPTALT